MGAHDAATHESVKAVDLAMRKGFAAGVGQALHASVVAWSDPDWVVKTTTNVASAFVQSVTVAERLRVEARTVAAEAAVAEPSANGFIEHVNQDLPIGKTWGNRETNCANSAIATDATIAGKPASALPGEVTNATKVGEYFGTTWSSEMGAPADIEAVMSRAPDGARAIVLGVAPDSEVGHFFNVAKQSATDAARDASVPTPPVADDAGRSADGSTDRGSQEDARAAGDSATPITCTPTQAITIYPRVGDANDDARVPHGPGLVLMGGGTDVDAAFVWTHDTVAASPSARASDLVVLRASGTNTYDAYAFGVAPFQSVRTVLIGDAATPGDLACAAQIVTQAEAVFFAGGDQSKYVAWKGSPLMTAVQDVYDRGGVVGGTSAGCAILGGFAYDSIAAGTANVATSDAIASPFESAITFTRGMLQFPALAGAITDPHFQPRNRMGRLAAFMARQHTDGAVTKSPAAVLGIGVDEQNAVVIDKNGVARLLQQSPGMGAAFFVRGAVPDQCAKGQPLIYRNLVVTRLDSPAQTFSLKTWCGSGSVYKLGVFGDAPPPYQPSDPYGATADGTTCVP